MRLWHEALLPYLPRQQLLGQHRECCALRGKGWGKKHAVVDYVFNHPYTMLFHYHLRVMEEMDRRGYKVDPLWLLAEYRGKRCPVLDKNSLIEITGSDQINNGWIYPEHHQKYLKECLKNLEHKGIRLELDRNVRKRQ